MIQSSMIVPVNNKCRDMEREREAIDLPAFETESGRYRLEVLEDVSKMRKTESPLEIFLVLGLPVGIKEIDLRRATTRIRGQSTGSTQAR